MKDYYVVKSNDLKSRKFESFLQAYNFATSRKLAGFKIMLVSGNTESTILKSGSEKDLCKILNQILN